MRLVLSFTIFILKKGRHSHTIACNQLWHQFVNVWFMMDRMRAEFVYSLFRCSLTIIRNYMTNKTICFVERFNVYRCIANYDLIQDNALNFSISTNSVILIVVTLNFTLFFIFIPKIFFLKKFSIGRCHNFNEKNRY